MEKKHPQTFNSGVCAIWTPSDEDAPKLKYNSLRFGNRVIGIKRHYAAASIQYTADKLIRIPHAPGIDTHDVVIINHRQYEIAQMQELDDTAPPCIDLTLHQLERNLIDLEKTQYV